MGGALSIQTPGKAGIYTDYSLMASQVVLVVKNPLRCRRPEFNPWVGKIPWRRA